MQSMTYSAIAPTERLIKKWLHDRQAFIVSLHQLCSLRPFNETNDLAMLSALMQDFCEKLVDYISYGHFTIYEKLIAITELSHHPMAHVPQHLLDSLLQTTHTALDFNDSCQREFDLIQLDNKLSHLAEHIAQRLEWEDKLIEKYSLAKAWILDLAKTA
jgi:regulator of sigma D